MTLEQDSENKLSEQLDQLIQTIDASGRAILPNSNDALLKSIVEAAGRIFNAQAASLLLVLEQEQGEGTGRKAAALSPARGLFTRLVFG